MSETKGSYKLQPGDKERIVQQYMAGVSISDLARGNDVAPNAIRNVLTRANVLGKAKTSDDVELSDYYLDILEWALRPLAISVRDPRVSAVSLGTLAAWGYLQPIDMKVGVHRLYETSAAGVGALKRHGRSGQY